MQMRGPQHALIAWLSFFSAADGVAQEEGSVRIERCAALWQLSVQIEQRPPYQSRLCQANVFDDMQLDSESTDHAVPRLWGAPRWSADGLSLQLAESEGGEVLWSGEVQPQRSDWQVLQASDQAPAARLKFTPLPMPHDMVQVRVMHASSSEILHALLQASDLQVQITDPLDVKLTMAFRVIEASSVLALIAFEHGLLQTWDAAGTLALRRPRDTEQLSRLTQDVDEHLQADLQGDAAATALVEQRLGELHALIKLRNAQDLPPDADEVLRTLAMRLQNAQDWTALVELRRDLLALAQAYDARKDVLRVASASADLAFALQQAGAPGDEDLHLLGAAEPVLLSNAPHAAARDIADHASALKQRGFERSALRLLESGWRACDADNALSWLLEFERLSWVLLEHYRAAERTDRAAELLAQWQRCITGQGTLTQAARIGATEQRLRGGHFLEAAADYELIFLRLPLLSTMDASELSWLLDNALLAHLSAGHFARAAEIHALADRRQAADPRGASERAAAQLLLDALAEAAPQAPSFWSQRWRTREALVSETSGTTARSPNVDRLKRAVILLLNLAERPTDAAGDKLGSVANRIATHEAAAVFGFSLHAPNVAQDAAQRHIAQALELRTEAGASAAQIRSRRQELESLVKISARHAARGTQKGIRP